MHYDAFAQIDTARNYIDSNGLKQGQWIERKLIVNKDYYKINNSSRELRRINVQQFFPVSEGEYFNGKRVGKWIDYSECLNYFTYNNILDFESENQRIDTSFVEGQLFLPLDTVKFTCLNGNCSLSTSNGRIFKSCKRENLENEILKAAQCKYNALIEKSKNTR